MKNLTKYKPSLLQGIIQFKQFSLFSLLNLSIQLPIERRDHLDVTLSLLLCKTLLLDPAWNRIHPSYNKEYFALIETSWSLLLAQCFPCSQHEQ